MKGIKKAIKYFGSQVKFAKAMGVTPPAVTKWLLGTKIPAERISSIVNATKGQVTAHDLRPDIFPEGTDLYIKKNAA